MKSEQHGRQLVEIPATWHNTKNTSKFPRLETEYFPQVTDSNKNVTEMADDLSKQSPNRLFVWWNECNCEICWLDDAIVRWLHRMVALIFLVEKEHFAARCKVSGCCRREIPPRLVCLDGVVWSKNPAVYREIQLNEEETGIKVVWTTRLLLCQTEL